MTCSHDIHLVRQCVLSVLCFVLLHHVLHFFDTVFVSLSHFTCLAHPFERKGALSVYYDIKKNEFKEYVGNAFFVCGCGSFLLVFGALTRSFPSRNKDWMKSLSVVVMKPTALYIYIMLVNVPASLSSRCRCYRGTVITSLSM